jgi:hypothetical protein
MKLQLTLPALLVFAATTASFSSFAATDTDKAQAPAAQTEQGAKKVKPHSLMEEKMGMPTKAVGEKSGVDKSKHSHQRDAK